MAVSDILEGTDVEFEHEATNTQIINQQTALNIFMACYLYTFLSMENDTR